MSNDLRHRLRRLHGDDGQTALEFIIVFPIWALCVIFMINMAIILSSAMLATTDLQRMAYDAAAVGCVSADSIDKLIYDDQPGINVEEDSWEIVARTPSSSGYDFQRSMVEASDGSLRGSDAICDDPTDISQHVGNAGYIWLRLSYRQKLVAWPAMDVTRRALVVSNSLNSEVGR